MRDPFEESLRDLLNKPSVHDDDACLGRVLETANRQVGAGDLFALIGPLAASTDDGRQQRQRSSRSRLSSRHLPPFVR